MNTPEFKRLLKVFADHPDDIDLSSGESVIQVQNQLIEFRATNKDGQIWVEEGGVNSPAEPWIAERLANLPLLARRIMGHADKGSDFVTPTGQYIDRIESAPTDTDNYVEDALLQLESTVAENVAFSSFVVYLTADAGEGKTTLINKLARKQAERYVTKQAKRLVVPIQLGGRSFLRLDDMIIGSVANNYKFRGLYIESFLELVKYGFIVPAFDGFEEMFVVGSSGEAVSSLGNLIANLDSMGQLIVSARTAYFEIRNFESQARLFDGLRGGEASFARLKLHRWSKRQFVSYWNNRGLLKPSETFDILATKLGSTTHPLLTRAVLVKRLADIAGDNTRFDRLLSRINAASASYFAELVDSILEREIESKWTDRAEESVHRPLIDISQHHQLLSMLAIEMAVTTSSQLSIEDTKLTTELFCDQQKLTPQVSRQVMARIFDHPLLSRLGTSANTISFDHEEFRDFFLGEALGEYLASENMIDLQRVLRKSTYPESVIDACIGSLKARSNEFGRTISFVQSAIGSENAASYAKETGIRIILRLLQQPGVQGCTISDAYIGSEAFVGATMLRVSFRNCFFHNALFRECKLTDCEFIECEFDSIELTRDIKIVNTKLENCIIYSTRINSDDDTTSFDPIGILFQLNEHDFQVETTSREDAESPTTAKDERLLLMNRALRAFQRSTGINETTLKLRLGKRSKHFEEAVLPDLLAIGILGLELYRGSGSDRRFRLIVKMTELEKALRNCKGSFVAFLKHFKDPLANKERL